LHIGQPLPLPTDLLAQYNCGVIIFVTSQVNIDSFSILVNLTSWHKVTVELCNDCYNIDETAAG